MGCSCLRHAPLPMASRCCRLPAAYRDQQLRVIRGDAVEHEALVPHGPGALVCMSIVHISTGCSLQGPGWGIARAAGQATSARADCQVICTCIKRHIVCGMALARSPLRQQVLQMASCLVHHCISINCTHASDHAGTSDRVAAAA